MLKIRTKSIAGALALLLPASSAFAEDVTLTIESWRNDDLAIWQEKIIPAFEAKHPGIKVKFTPSAPTEYNAALNSKLEAGSAGDLITCRPFDASLAHCTTRAIWRLVQRPRGHVELLRRCQVRMDHGRRCQPVLCSDGVRDSRFHLQCRRICRNRHVKCRTTEDEFFAALDKIKEERQLHPDGHGHQRPVGSGHDGLQQYRPELLERRRRAQCSDQGRAEADR